MPRANRYYAADCIWHITHRCHQRAFLLKFNTERYHWVHWLAEAFALDDCSNLASVYSYRIGCMVDNQEKAREPQWTEVVAVGDAGFVQEVQHELRSIGATWPMIDDREWHSRRDDVTVRGKRSLYGRFWCANRASKRRIQLFFATKIMQYNGLLRSDPDHPITTAGTLSDLYDFNQDTQGIGRHAATMQLGFGCGSTERNKGRIFLHKITFREQVAALYIAGQDRFMDRQLPSP